MAVSDQERILGGFPTLAAMVAGSDDAVGAYWAPSAERILDAIPDQLVYWTADLTCRFANKAFCERFGVSARDAVGARLIDLFGESPAAQVQPYIEAALAGRRQHFVRTVQNPQGEAQHFRTDYIPCVVDARVVGVLVRGSDIGLTKATEASLRAEIATRDHANDLLRKTQYALQEAQRLGQIGSWEWQMADDVVYWSERLYRLYDLDPESAPPNSTKLATYYEAESWLRLDQALKRAQATGEPFSLELKFVHANGERGWAEARGEAVRDETGAIVLLRGVSQNITARKDSEEQRERLIEQLTAANVERAHFARAASHDLREPLRMVTAYCGRLSKIYADRLDERGAEYLSLAVGAASRMAQILDDLVDFERLGEGARRRWFDATEAVEGALANLEERIHESGASISVGPLPRIWGNSIRFERLIQNLVGNALKYVAPDVAPQVALHASREGEFWRFSLSDNGIGVEPRYRERIFEPFKRLHTRDHYDGTGLGLSICKKIVEGFGGSIWVQSNPDQGATFHFTITVKRDDEG